MTKSNLSFFDIVLIKKVSMHLFLQFFEKEVKPNYFGCHVSLKSLYHYSDISFILKLL